MFTTLSSAKAKITELEEQVQSSESQNSETENKIVTLESKLDEMGTTLKAETERADNAVNQLESLQSQLEMANQEISDSKGDHEDIESRIKHEATEIATAQVAASGNAPVEGNLEDDTVQNTAEGFWSEYKVVPASEKGTWYRQNKSRIGR